MAYILPFATCHLLRLQFLTGSSELLLLAIDFAIFLDL